MIGKKERVFLSTLSLRRATDVACGDRNKLRNFYPRSPCGERQTSLVVIGTNCVISIHALLAESDIPGVDFRNAFMHFYPRSPCGERRVRLGPGHPP